MTSPFGFSTFNIAYQPYTPVLAGADTFTDVNFTYQVISGLAYIWGIFTAASPNSDTAFIGIPNTVIVDPTQISDSRSTVGRMLIDSSAAVAKEYNLMTRIPTFNNGVHAGLITTAAVSPNTPIVGLDGTYSLWMRVPVIPA